MRLGSNLNRTALISPKHQNNKIGYNQNKAYEETVKIKMYYLIKLIIKIIILKKFNRFHIFLLKLAIVPLMPTFLDFQFINKKKICVDHLLKSQIRFRNQ
jgi:hypothetical protein